MKIVTFETLGKLGWTDVVWWICFALWVLLIEMIAGPAYSGLPKTRKRVIKRPWADDVPMRRHYVLCSCGSITEGVDDSTANRERAASGHTEGCSTTTANTLKTGTMFRFN